MNNGHKLIKVFNGHSGSTVLLKEWPEGGYYVEKLGNTQRNYERMNVLTNLGIPVAKILHYEHDHMLMEYLHGLDMKKYLIHNKVDLLFKFFCVIIDSFSKQTTVKDYTETYKQKLEWIESVDGLPFTKNELLSKLPKELPQSTYHGDMTLENVLYTDSGFKFIDPMTTEYDSYIFDIAKLRQDLECKWFLRNDNIKLDVKLQNIQEKLKKEYPHAFDDNILIMMLLRVLSHCEDGDSNHQFLMKEIHRLWK